MTTSHSTPGSAAWRQLAVDLQALDGCPPCQAGRPCEGHDCEALVVRAARLVEGLGLSADRLAHTLAVGRRCAQLAAGRDRLWVVRAELAGTLHDVGYAHPVTGMHAVDGAAWLDSLGFPGWLVAAVAHHSTAHWECRARAIENPWPEPEQDLADLVWIADFTTTPSGDRTTVAERTSEIRSRYPAASPVIAALDAAVVDQAAAASRLAEWSTPWAAEWNQGGGRGLDRNHAGAGGGR